MSTERFLRNFSFALLSNVAGIGLTLLATLITIRSLEVSQWAVTAAFITLGPLFSTALSLGSVSHHTRELSILPPERARAIYQRFVKHRLLWAATLASVGTVTSIITEISYPALVALLAATRFARTGATVFLQARRAFNVVAIVTILDRLTALAIVAVVNLGTLSIATLPLAQAAGSTVAVIVALTASRGPTSTTEVYSQNRWPEALWMWRGSGSFGIASLAGSIQQADVVLVSLVAGSTVGGYFAAAARVPGALGVVGSSLALVVLPAFSRPDIILPGQTRARLRVLAFATGTVIAILIATAPWWTPILLGADYLPALVTIQIYLLSVLLNMAYQPSIAFLQSRGLARPAARIVAAQVALTLPLQAAAAHLWGASGAAMAYTVLLAAALVATSRLIRRQSPVVDK